MPNPAEAILAQAAASARPDDQTERDPAPPQPPEAAAPQPEGGESGGLEESIARAIPQAQSDVTNLIAQQIQAERARADQLEAYLIAQWIENQPDEKAKEAARAQALAYYQAKQLQQQLQAERMARAQLEQRLTPIIQEAVYSRLSQKHGIPKEVLRKYGQTPEQVQNLVQAYAELKKLENFQKRIETRIDAAPTESGNQASARPPIEEIKKKYLGTGRIADYLRELRQAGG